MATWRVRFVSELYRRQGATTDPVPPLNRVQLYHLGYAVLLAARGIVQDAPSSPADEHEVRAAAALDESGRVTVRRQGATAHGIREPLPPVRGDR